MALNRPWDLKQNNCCVSPLRLPKPSWLLHPPVKPRPLDYLLNRFERIWGQLFHWSPLPEHLQPKSSSNLPSPHLRAAAEAISPATRQDWRPRWQRRQGKALVMVLDGFCGHRLMIWRPSDMVSVVDWWLIVVLCVKKYGTFERSSQKNNGPHQPPTLPPHRNLWK
jgi:hypothetical protein